MKKLLFLISIVLATSCTQYAEVFKIEVTYNNGDTEIITYRYAGGCCVGIRLRAAVQSGSFSGGGGEMCLYGRHSRPIACGVRKYKILNHKRRPI